MINVMTPSKFSKMIEADVREKRCSHMDAIVDHCVKNDIEVEHAAKLLTKSIKLKLAEDAAKLNMLKKEVEEEDA